jgi:hypothetical protein
MACLSTSDSPNVAIFDNLNLVTLPGCPGLVEIAGSSLPLLALFTPIDRFYHIRRNSVV